MEGWEMAFQIVLECVIVLLGTCGMILHSGWIKGETRKDFFRYYTNLSNLLVTVFFLFRLVIRIRGSYDGFFGRIVFSQIWLYSVAMSIFLTFAIFHFVLMPSIKQDPEISDEFRHFSDISNIIVHYLVPLLSLLDWFLFAVKTELRYSWALIWTVIPWIYVIYAFIRAADGVPLEHTDSAYPYEFMDAGKHGWKTVIRNCLLVGIIFAFIGFLFLFVRKCL